MASLSGADITTIATVIPAIAAAWHAVLRLVRVFDPTVVREVRRVASGAEHALADYTASPTPLTPEQVASKVASELGALLGASKASPPSSAMPKNST